MIKGQQKIQVRSGLEDLDGIGIRPEDATYRHGKVDDRDGMPPRIAIGIGIDSYQALEANIQAGFFLGLANSRLLHPLPDFDSPTGKRPGAFERFNSAPDENNFAVGKLNDYVCRQARAWSHIVIYLSISSIIRSRLRPPKVAAKVDRVVLAKLDPFFFQQAFLKLVSPALRK